MRAGLGGAKRPSSGAPAQLIAQFMPLMHKLDGNLFPQSLIVTPSLAELQAGLQWRVVPLALPG